MLDSLKQKKNFQRIKMRIKTGDLVKVINGKEKVIISQERLAYNKLYTHKDPKYILITEVKSQKRNSFIPARNTYVKLKNVRTKKLRF